MLPSIFSENLFDDFFDRDFFPVWSGVTRCMVNAQRT